MKQPLEKNNIHECELRNSHLMQRKYQRKIKAEEKKLKFIAFSYSEKGYCEHLLNIERRLESAVVLN